jgi:outer membrane protein OmpA-like peptidoglycan-associated protein
MEDSMSLGRNTRATRPFVASLFAILALSLISASAFAQSDPNPQWDIFVGYQYLHPGASVPLGDPANPTTYPVPSMSRGLGGAVTYNFDPHWGLETDLGHNWATSDSETTISAGPRYMWRADSGNFFIHGLLSYNHLGVSGLNNGSSGIGAILGGGWDLPITKSFAWRVFGADFVWARHNYADYADPEFPNLRRPTLEGVRVRTGIVYSWGGTEPIMPTAACTVQPSEVLVGEPLTATVTASNFNPKHSVAYSWSGDGGRVTGKDNGASIDTANATPGTYKVTAHVTDARVKKNGEATCSASYTIKPLPPKNPPTISLSASPSSVVSGGSVSLTASCSSPDNVAVSVANWTSSTGTVSGSGSSASFSTTGLPAGPVTVTATCTDSRGLTAQASTQFMVENPPPPPVNPEMVRLEARLALHSIYFVVDFPKIANPKGGLLPSQQKTLVSLATDFKKYLEIKPDAHLILGGHADHRGSEAYNKALTERRVNRTKSFLVEQGVPEANIDTKAFGKDENMTDDDVKAEVASDSELTSEERQRILKNIVTIRMASNRRVDVTLTTTGQTSVRQFPFNSADALTLIGGRESEMKKKPAKAPVKKAPAKKP